MAWLRELLSYAVMTCFSHLKFDFILGLILAIIDELMSDGWGGCKVSVINRLSHDTRMTIDN